MSKELPSNEQAEKAVLGSMITDPQIIEKMMAWIRTPDAFYYHRNKKIWNAMLELYRRGISIDPVTIVNKCHERYGDGVDSNYVAALHMDGVKVENADHYAKIVWQRHMERATISVAQRLDEASRQGTDKIEDLLLTYNKHIEELANLQPARDRSIEVVTNSATESIIKGHQIIEYGVPYLDDYAGGMTRGEFSALGGRPGHGKTTLMLNICNMLTRQKDLKIMLFNREMKNESAIAKLMVMNSKHLTYDMLRHKDLNDNVKGLVEKMRPIIIERFKNVQMYDDIINLEDSMREIRRYEPDVVIDDYIQLVRTPSRKSRDRRFEIEDIVSEYKWVLKRVNAHGILVSQLSRDIERRLDPVPTMADYAEGGTIEQNAETCMFIFYGYSFDPEENNQYQTDIIVKKARYGRIGSYMIGFNGNKCKFYANGLDAKNG